MQLEEPLPADFILTVQISLPRSVSDFLFWTRRQIMLHNSKRRHFFAGNPFLDEISRKTAPELPVQTLQQAALAFTSKKSSTI